MALDMFKIYFAFILAKTCAVQVLNDFGSIELLVATIGDIIV